MHLGECWRSSQLGNSHEGLRDLGELKALRSCRGFKLEGGQQIWRWVNKFRTSGHTIFKAKWCFHWGSLVISVWSVVQLQLCSRLGLIMSSSPFGKKPWPSARWPCSLVAQFALCNLQDSRQVSGPCRLVSFNPKINKVCQQLDDWPD